MTIPALDPDTATGQTKDLLDAVKRGLGVVPNLFRVTARSPAALEGMVTLFAAISKGSLDARAREAIALATAEVDGCDYCLSAHSYLANRAGLGAAEIERARAGGGSDPKIAAVARLARALVETRGHAGEGALAQARAAGLDDAQVLEVIANVAWSTFTNYVNETARTEIDFDPIVRHGSASAR